MSHATHESWLHCAYAINAILVVRHTYVHRKRLSTFWEFLCRSGLRTCFVPEAEDPSIKTQVDELRVHNFLRLLKFSQLLMPGCLLLAALVLQCPDYRSLLLLVASWIVYLILCVLLPMKAKWKACEVQAVVCVLAMMHCCCTMCIYDPQVFYLQGGHRVIVRLLLGLMALNCKFSLCFNVVASLITCGKHLNNEQIFHSAQESTHDPRWVVFPIEGASCLVVSILLYHVERGIKKWFCAKRDMNSAKQAHRAVGKLLSVLCDAEVHLGPNLEIIEPSSNLSHMVLDATDAGSMKGLEGRCFECFVWEDDQERFRDFLANSVAQISDGLIGRDGGSCGVVGPPTSLQVKLQNILGATFKVQLFHVSLRDNAEQQGHLLGIRECCPLQREIATPSSNHIEHVAASMSADVCTPPDETPASKDHAPAVLEHPSDSSSETSSKSSSSRVSAASNLQGTYLSELSGIHVKLDVFSPRFAVREVSLSFSGSGELPNFADCVPHRNWEAFRTWVQSELNAQFSGHDSACPHFGPTFLQWPQRSSSLEEFMLAAETATLQCDDVGDIDDEGGALIAQIRFEGFSQWHRNAARVRSRRLLRRGRGARTLDPLEAIEENANRPSGSLGNGS